MGRLGYILLPKCTRSLQHPTLLALARHVLKITFSVYKILTRYPTRRRKLPSTKGRVH